MSETHHSVNGSESSTLEYEQEPFETIRDKVVQLCIDIGFGAPSETERMTGGSFNRVIGLAFSTTPITRYVLRIPRLELSPTEVQSIKDQVAVLLYLSTRLPVAKVAAYDCTTRNAIKTQYVLQERLPGQSVEAIYDTLTLEERLQLASSLAELVQNIDSIVLPRFGRLIQSTPIPDVSHKVLPSLNDEEIVIVGYRLEFSKNMPITDEQSISSLLRLMCKSRSEEDDYDDELKSYWQRLQQMITEMESLGLISDEKEEPRLWHWDLSAQNVLVRKVAGSWSVSGVLDWDDVMSVPPVIGRKPPIWLWLPEVRVEDADTSEPTVLSDNQRLIKDRFEEVVLTSIPTFPDDAYYRGRWLRRITNFALHGFSYSQDWERYNVLIQDWNQYRQKLVESGYNCGLELINPK